LRVRARGIGKKREYGWPMHLEQGQWNVDEK
jgi:hypothetical protein